MLMPHAFAPIPALVLALVLTTGCSGDDESEPGAAPSASQQESGDTQQKIRRCRVTAEVSGDPAIGAVGRGRVVIGGGSGPDAFYEFTSGDLVLAAYSAGPDFTPSVTVTSAGTTYSTLADTEGLEIRSDGSSAIIDATASGADPADEDVEIAAEFTCR